MVCLTEYSPSIIAAEMQIRQGEQLENMSQGASCVFQAVEVGLKPLNSVQREEIAAILRAIAVMANNFKPEEDFIAQAKNAWKKAEMIFLGKKETEVIEGEYRVISCSGAGKETRKESVAHRSNGFVADDNTRKRSFLAREKISQELDLIMKEKDNEGQFWLGMALNEIFNTSFLKNQLSEIGIPPDRFKIFFPGQIKANLEAVKIILTGLVKSGQAFDQFAREAIQAAQQIGENFNIQYWPDSGLFIAVWPERCDQYDHSDPYYLLAKQIRVNGEWGNLKGIKDLLIN